jgi:outer membrane protein TolC
LLALGSVVTPASSIAAGISFDGAQRLAAEHAPALKARQAQIAAAREEAGRAAALPDPKLTLGLANWPITGPDAFDLRADEMTMKQIGVMQEFPARAKRRARQAVADRSIGQAQALSTAEQLAVRRGSAEAWLEVWSAQRELASLQALREPTAVAVRTAKARLAGGAGMVTDALATQSAVLELENRIDAAQSTLDAARRAHPDEVPSVQAARTQPQARAIGTSTFIQFARRLATRYA